MNVYQKKSIYVKMDLPNKIMEVITNGSVKSEHFRTAWLKALDMSEKHQICKWLTDDSQLMVIHPDDSRWLTEEWYPLSQLRTGHLGRQYVANILSKKFYAELTVKQTVEDIRQKSEARFVKGIEQKYFEEVSEARLWLLSLNI